MLLNVLTPFPLWLLFFSLQIASTCCSLSPRTPEGLQVGKKDFQLKTPYADIFTEKKRKRRTMSLRNEQKGGPKLQFYSLQKQALLLNPPSGGFFCWTILADATNYWQRAPVILSHPCKTLCWCSFCFVQYQSNVNTLQGNSDCKARIQALSEASSRLQSCYLYLFSFIFMACMLCCKAVKTQ